VKHLDTSFLVDLLRETARDGTGPAHAFLAESKDEPLGVSVHVACELHAGVENSRDPAAERVKIERLLSAIDVVTPGPGFASLYGRTSAELRRRGQSIATMDLLIAVAALECGAGLVTRNARDFDRVPGLAVSGYVP
jgi:tRNA(fMet)-specific endonuclease VapC